MTWSDRFKNSVKGLLVLLAVVAALFAAVGVITLMHRASCDRLDEERISHLEPGYDVPGPGAYT